MNLLSAQTVRRCLIADPGKLIISADFDQIELRVAAALSGEQSLIDAAKRGVSLHKITAIKIFGENYTPDQYRFTKNLNFGWLFGGRAATLSKQTGVPFEECETLIKRYEIQMPALAEYRKQEQRKIITSAFTSVEYKAFQLLRTQLYAYRDDTKEGRQAKSAIKIEIDRLLYRKIGYAVTPFGRRLIVDANKPYTVVNYVVQSTAADILKTALLDVMDDPELEPTVLLPIHDEILGQAPSHDAEYFVQRYCEVMSREFMGVPITASGKICGRSWGHGYRK
jgi:DNA polymerase-1